MGQEDQRKSESTATKWISEKAKEEVPASFFVFLRFQMAAEDFQKLKSLWTPAFPSSGITDLVKYHISELPPQFLKILNFSMWERLLIPDPIGY